MSEQFEHNIRKKLQEAEVPFEPQAWDRMEKLLDQPRNRRPMWWWFGGLALILGLAGWWWFTRPAGDNSTSSPKTENFANTTEPKQEVENGDPNKNAVTETDKLIVDKPADAAIVESENTKARQKKPIAPIFQESNAVKKSAVNSETENHVDNPANSSVVTFQKSNLRAGSKSDTRSDRKNDVDKPDNPAAKVQEENNFSVAGRKDVENPSSSVPLSSQKDKNNTPAPASVDNPSLPPTRSEKNQTANIGAPVHVDNAANPASTDSNSLGASSRENWKAPRRKGFDGGIHLGPDVNATGSFTGMRAGFTGGLLLRYHVNNKWYLSTGAAYTKKLYAASPKEYNSPYPGNYVDIDADCDVIDVPLNVHFVFAENASGRWNVSAGASTYFMLREKYEYYYPNNYKRTRVFSNQNQHWFSVINLSAGWEKNTKGRLNWGLQPYLKIPAGGVGEGKVKLYSAGLSLQLTMGKK